MLLLHHCGYRFVRVVTVSQPRHKMDDAEVFEVENDIPRRNLRFALSEINEVADEPDERTPNKSTSPDEMLIVQRGPRRKPVTWSPFDYDRSKLFIPSRDKTPEPVSKKCEIHPRLRRRLVLSPTKGPPKDLGAIIAKKLKSLKNLQTA